MKKDPKWPADQVERWPLSRIIPDARNPRTHSDAQIGQIAASMREWGWTNPLLVDENGSLIAGHGRLSAAYMLEYTEAPVMVARGWTEAQKRAYIIADNKLALNAGWDEDLLAIELGELDRLDFNLETTGFNLDELARLLPRDGIDVAPPTAFNEYDNDLETTYCCPKCQYEWSGKPK